MTQQQTKLKTAVIRNTLKKQSIEKLITLCQQHHSDDLIKSLVSILAKKPELIMEELKNSFEKTDFEEVLEKLNKKKLKISKDIDFCRDHYKSLCEARKQEKLAIKASQRKNEPFARIYTAYGYENYFFKRYLENIADLKADYKKISDEIYFFEKQYS